MRILHFRGLNLATFLFTAAVLYGQQSARLIVTVVDPSGAAIPDAAVEIMNLSRNTVRLAEPDKKGSYSLGGLDAGQHRVEILKKGFTTYVIEELSLHPRDLQTLRVTLEVASVARQEITVKGEVEGLDEASSSGTVVSGTFADAVPVNDRSIDALVQLAPGTSQVSGGPGNSGLHVNGQRSNSNYYMLDGVSANTGSFGGAPGPGGPTAGNGSSTSRDASGINDLISLDALSEMRVQTSAFAPEYGRTPGGQITLVSRSGTTAFHGSAFEHTRLNNLRANDWFANSARLARAKLKYNDFGATLGGPVRDKTFFFASYEGSLIEQPHTEVDSVPDSTSRAAAAPALRPFLNAFPIANGKSLGSGAAQFLTSYSTPSDSHQGSFRVDRVINDRMNLFIRYSLAPSDATNRGGFNSSANSVTHSKSENQSLTGSFTWIDREANVNTVRLNYTHTLLRSRGGLDNYGGAQELLDRDLFPAGYSSANGSFGMNINGVGGFSVGRDLHNTQNQLNAVFDQTVSSNGHEAKAGFDYRVLAPTTFNKPYSAIVTFNGINAGDTDSLLSGTAATAITSSTVDATHPRYQNFSFYVQDTWKINQQSTITYGLRWDLNPPPTARGGSKPFGLDDSYNLSSSNPLYHTRWFNIAPRLGFSNQLSSLARYETILRGGIGVFFDTGYGTSGSAFNSAPYTNSNITQEPAFPLSATVLQAPSLPPAEPYGMASAADPHLQSPLIGQWNLTIEQHLGRGQLFSAGYAGSSGSKLLRNSTYPGFFSTQYNLLQIASNGGSSNYNSIQTSYRRTLGRSFQAQAAYTLAKSTDTQSNDAGMAGFALISNNKLSASDFDVRHTVSASGSLRFPSVRYAYLRPLLSNWNAGWMFSARSALPLNVTGLTQTSGNTSGGAGFFFAQVRPDLTGAPIWIAEASAPGGKILNRAAFKDAASGTEGNLKRNFIRGFGQSQLDFSVNRDLIFSEKLTFQLRADAFNIFNHPNFADPSAFEGANLASSNFGVASRMSYNSGFGGTAQSSGAPRSLQFSVRAQF